MELSQTVPKVIKELSAILEKVDFSQIEDFCDAIIKSDRVFVLGVGREGLSSRAFAMRLTHLGRTCYWIWDDTTPSIGKGDLLVANCGGGNITSVYHVTQKAKQAGANVATITANPEGKVGKIADTIIHLRADVGGARVDVVHSIQPMGSLFEQGLLILGDLVILRLMEKMGISVEEMSKRHRNVE